MFFCQNNYIDKLINKFNINTFYKSSETSLAYYVQMRKSEKTITLQKIQIYQQRVEFINFVAIIIKLDVIFAALKLLEFLINSLTYYIKQINRVLKYLTHIKNYVIVFNDQANNLNIIFIDFSDVSFANDLNIR